MRGDSCHRKSTGNVHMRKLTCWHACAWVELTNWRGRKTLFGNSISQKENRQSHLLSRVALGGIVLAKQPASKIEPSTSVWQVAETVSAGLPCYQPTLETPTPPQTYHLPTNAPPPQYDLHVGLTDGLVLVYFVLKDDKHPSI